MRGTGLPCVMGSSTSSAEGCHSHSLPEKLSEKHVTSTKHRAEGNHLQELKLQDEKTKAGDVTAMEQGTISEQGTALPGLGSSHLLCSQPPTTAEPGREGARKHLRELMERDRHGQGKNPMH